MVEVRKIASTMRGVLSEPLHELAQSLKGAIVPIFTTEHQRYGVWKVVQRSSAGTSIIATPDAGGSIVVTDLIVSADRAPVWKL
jgi:hypothetical protein